MKKILLGAIDFFEDHEIFTVTTITLVIVGLLLILFMVAHDNEDKNCKRLYGSDYQFSGGLYQNSLCIGPNGEIKGSRRQK